MFCDYCKCSDCQNGHHLLSHAQTEEENWICDVCFEYDLCTSVPGHNGPCEETECQHRPKLISKWIAYKEKQ